MEPTALIEVTSQPGSLVFPWGITGNGKWLFSVIKWKLVYTPNKNTGYLNDSNSFKCNIFKVHVQMQIKWPKLLEWLKTETTCTNICDTL